MWIVENILEWIVYKYNFRGKNTIIRCVMRLFPCDLYIKSVYGMFLKLNYFDKTWYSCCLGYKESIVPQELYQIPGNACFIDIGANVGVFTLLAAKQMGLNGIVICYEVNPVTYSSLVKNIERNNLQSLILPFNVGLSDSSQLSYVTFQTNHSGVSHLTADKEKGMPVVTSTWSDMIFLEKVIGNRDVVIKVDVEGMELGVLRGIKSLIEKIIVKKIIIEIDEENLSRYGSTRQELYEFLEELRFIPKLNIKRGHYDEVFIRD